MDVEREYLPLQHTGMLTVEEGRCLVSGRGPALKSARAKVQAAIEQAVRVAEERAALAAPTE